jgi:hypothetical protein
LGTRYLSVWECGMPGTCVQHDLPSTWKAILWDALVANEDEIFMFAMRFHAEGHSLSHLDTCGPISELWTGMVRVAPQRRAEEGYWNYSLSLISSICIVRMMLSH